VFAFCVIVCAYLQPKQTTWKTSHLKAGSVWRDDNLVSKIDFLIKKTDAEMAKEKKATSELLYFTYKENAGAGVLKHTTAIPANKQGLIKAAIDNLYKKYLYFSEKPVLSKDSILYLVTGNEVKQVNKSQLLGKPQAQAWLMSFVNDEIVVNELLKHLVPNIVYDEALSKELSASDPEMESVYKAMVHKGDVLLFKNDVVTPAQLNIITNYNNELELQSANTPILSHIAGQLMACLLILGIMMLFLAFFRKSIFSQNTHVTFIFLIIVLIVLASSIICRYNINYIYSVPFCLVPILIRVFFDSRTALFNFLNIVLLCSFFTIDKFEFVYVQLIAGIGTIFSVADMGKRSKLFISALLTFLFYILAFVSYHLINDTAVVLKDVENYIPFVISSLCVLFSFPLIFLFEKLFGFVSDFTLLELCDLNSPLLRQLSQKVPGTFQHSLQVANLAEEACYKIGGNALLVRTGAMYHDVGKMENSRFFTENQVGEVSPHEDLSPEESARIIIDHVIRGVEKAKEHQLPESIIDFIRTHHGTTTTRYFLHNYKKEHDGEIINEDLFRYPGPIPFSKETAVLMMADGVEAASRSLKKYDAITIDELVDKIINHLTESNQFINADITFRDINQIKKIFKKRLMNIYHVRIEYPR
jgi:putative nucleotidyltransferase with HDIG domain